MSAEHIYTMYRQDARGTIEVDLSDPVYSLDGLIDKQTVIVDALQRDIDSLSRRLNEAESRMVDEQSTLHKLEIARDASRKALGPSARERAREVDHG